VGLMSRIREFFSSVDSDEPATEHEEYAVADRSEWALGRAEDGTHAVAETARTTETDEEDLEERELPAEE
jgi:hypothetical protein